MKEITGILGLTPDKIKTVVQENPVIQQKLKERIEPYPGQKCWELDLNTGKITEATYKEEIFELGEHRRVDMSGLLKNNLGGLRKKIIQKKDCIYTTAINLKNAEKHFKRLFKNKK